jgi:cyclopropane fatty-acyl-phospholipid synthase-like methyltransferase
MAQPDYADHFTHGGVFRVWREGMYGIRETYDILRWLGGYDAHYVNVGYWTEGLDTKEAGRKLALLHGEMLGLKPGDRLLDCGSGLGQGAIDHVRKFDLAEVCGINPSGQQVGFAKQLIAHEGLSDKIRFIQDDACKVVFNLPERSFTHAMAVECFTYFPDKLAFLTGLKRVLGPGGKFVFCDTTGNRHQSRFRRKAVGLISNAETHPRSYFTDLFAQAGYVDVQVRDITKDVVPFSVGHARKQIEADPKRLRAYGWTIDKAVRAFIDNAESQMHSGAMTYDIMVGTVPG